MDYYETLFQFPQNFTYHFKDAYNIDIQHGLVICGMGGSAIAGDFIKSLAYTNSQFPVIVVRGYKIPKYLTKEWTVVVVSYSGNTEETLSCVKQFLNIGCDLYLVSSGGELEKISKEHDVKIFKVSSNLQPREAFYHIFGLLCGMLNSSLNLGITTAEVSKLSYILDDLKMKTQVLEEYGKSIIGKQISILSSNKLSAVALRFRCQLNENSKLHASSYEVPEFSHNAIIGYDGLYSANLHNIVLRGNLDDERTNIHLDFAQNLINNTSVLNIHENSHFLQLMSAVTKLDYISIFCALYQGLDPHSINKINQLKNILRSKKIFE